MKLEIDLNVVADNMKLLENVHAHICDHGFLYISKAEVAKK